MDSNMYIHVQMYLLLWIHVFMYVRMCVCVYMDMRMFVNSCIRICLCER